MWLFSMWCWVQETACGAIAEVGGRCEAGPVGTWQ